MVYMPYRTGVSSIMVQRPKVKQIFEGGIDLAKKLNDDEKGFTESIIYCIGGQINNFMFHLYPPDAIANFGEIEKITNTMDIINPLKGLIIGGSYHRGKPRASISMQSLDLLGRLKKILKPFTNKDFTIFYGQKNSLKKSGKEANFLYDTAEDTYYVNVYKEKITPENIKKHFKFIRISPNDEVYIKGQKIDPKAIET